MRSVAQTRRLVAMHQQGCGAENSSTNATHPESISGGDAGIFGGAVLTSTPRLSLLDHFVDWMNPILVKEVRQAFKGQVFVLAFGLLIFVCWIISVVGALAAGDSLEYSAWAPRFFTSYFIPLAFAVGVVVPYMTFHNMLSELTDDTFDMLRITTLRARTIINGKLASSVVQILLLYSAITPFIALTSLLQGFRLFPASLALGVSLFASLALCMISLFLATLDRSRFGQAFLSLAWVVGLLFNFMFVRFLFDPGFWNVTGNRDSVGGFGVFALATSGIVLLLREYSIAIITFNSANRSTGIRVVTSMIIVVAWLIFHVATVSGPVDPGDFLGSVTAMTVATCIYLGTTALCLCAEPASLSRRVKSQVIRLPRWISFGINPWLPGCSRGFLYLLIHLVPCIWICIRSRDWFYSMRGPLLYRDLSLFATSMVAILYTIFFLGLATIEASRISRQPSVNGMNQVPLKSGGVIAMFVVGPPMVEWLLKSVFDIRVGWELWMVTSPVSTFLHIDSWPDSNIYSPWTMLTLLAILAGLVSSLNLPGVFRSFAEHCHGSRSFQTSTSRRESSS